MNLPPLPEPYGWFDVRGSADNGYTEDQMREYGELCRREALEDAAKEVDHIMFFNGKTFGEKIRELSK